MTPLPELDPVSLAHSQRVLAALKQRFEHSPWLSFAEFMQHALYAPDLGYYVAGSAKFGLDFVTAPEISPLFGQTLTSLIAPVLRQHPHLLELGAGSGALAEQVLNHCAADYQILELSPDLRQRQQSRLARFGSRVRWLDTLPAEFNGAVLANEVLDAVPCELVRYENGQYQQLGYCLIDGQLQLKGRPATGELLTLAQARLPAIEGYTSELNPQAEALLSSVTSVMRQALAVWVDYGFERPVYYHPQRQQGTLMAHYRQHAHSDPLFAIGLQDLTAHVDFTAMAEAAVDAGGEIACYCPQAQALLKHGLLEHLAATGEVGSVAYLKATNQVNRLLSPAEMGELFKVLVVSKGDWPDLPLLTAADQSYRL
jgi:SAM-dependent MidA family methyltransferase